MVYATMGELQKAHSELQRAHSELQILNEKLVEMAERDALTGLFSRGKIEEIIRQVLENAAETGRPASLIMVDVDHFKQVNDVYGHHTGDVVLRRMAELFREAVSGRHGSAAGRWGGEEFFLVLPETGSREAVDTAESLRRRTEAETFPGVGKVTISLGVITPTGDMDSRAVFSKEDKALYDAKEGGRNRVVKAE
jgi:diguanylate cyclase (GGDEF)-like protein